MKLFNIMVRSVKTSSPSILVGIGIVGVVCTIVEACKATPKAVDILEKQKKAAKEEGKNPEEIKLQDKVKAVWKVYLPTGLMGVSSIACFVCSNNIHLKREAGLATFYTMAQNTLQTQHDKMVELVGEKKAEEIHDEVSKEMRKNVPLTAENIYSSNGSTLFFNQISGRYIEREPESIRKAENDFNHDLIHHETRMTINEWQQNYLNDGPIKYAGDMGGWDINETGKMEISITWDTIDGRPCGNINYVNPPMPFNK